MLVPILLLDAELDLESFDHEFLDGQVAAVVQHPHISKVVSVGFSIVAYEKTKLHGRKVLMGFPEYEIVEEGEETLMHLNRSVSIHSAGERISFKKHRELIDRATFRESRKRDFRPCALETCPKTL